MKLVEMLRKLIESDREEVLSFLNEEPEINLFIIGDIKNYGFDNSIQDIWASFKNNEMVAVLLRYRNNFIPYFKTYSFDISKFIEIINSFEGEKAISGRKKITDLFKEKLNISREKNTYFCSLKKLSAEIDYTNNYNVKQAQEKHCKEVATLLNSIPEFAKTNELYLKEKIRSNSGRIFIIENNQGKIIATASSSAENERSAMISAVATSKEYRQKGLASECVMKLCNTLLEEGKNLCLFYNNPMAGNIYKRIGFKDIDLWTMLFL